ncbi:hypothetical protein ACFL35_04265 [Candidatus Riflebacteria bacterium]
MNQEKKKTYFFYGLIILLFVIPLLLFSGFYAYLYLPKLSSNPAVIILKSPEFGYVYFVCFAWLFSTISIPFCWAYYDVFIKKEESAQIEGENGSGQATEATAAEV